MVKKHRRKLSSRERKDRWENGSAGCSRRATINNGSKSKKKFAYKETDRDRTED